MARADAGETRTLADYVEWRVKVIRRRQARIAQANDRHDGVFDGLRQRHSIRLVLASDQRQQLAVGRGIGDLSAYIRRTWVPVVRSAPGLPKEERARATVRV